MNKCTQHLVLIAVVVVCLFLSGCYSHSILFDAKKAEDGRCIVFGKITLSDGGKDLRWDGVYAEKYNYLVILPSNSSVPKGAFLKDQGYFYWLLEPGEYKIISLVSHGHTVIPLRKSMIQVKFDVPENAASVDIGELVCEVGRRSFDYEINTNTPDAIEGYKRRFPGNATEVLSRPMEKYRIGEFEKKDPICSSTWGLDCKAIDTEAAEFEFLGVHPISPHANTDLPAEINSVMPLFEWHPSKTKNVTYDLMVYEAGRWTNPMTIVDVPAKPVLYIQGLEQPRYRMVKKLEPESRYFWTVRLRKNDIVTTWSRFNYKNHYNWLGTGLHEIFCFSTPPHGA